MLSPENKATIRNAVTATKAKYPHADNNTILEALTVGWLEQGDLSPIAILEAMNYTREFLDQLGELDRQHETVEECRKATLQVIGNRQVEGGYAPEFAARMRSAIMERFARITPEAWAGTDPRFRTPRFYLMDAHHAIHMATEEENLAPVIAALAVATSAPVEFWHTGGGCTAAAVVLERRPEDQGGDRYIMVTHLDGPWVGGYYAGDEDCEGTPLFELPEDSLPSEVAAKVAEEIAGRRLATTPATG